MAKTKIPGEYLKDSVVRFTAKAGENITKGQAVYISGISGETPVVSLADADDTNKMPAFGLAESTVSTNASVEVTSNGTLAGIDTSSYALGDILYISTTAGSLTNDPSGLEASKVQNIGMVQRVHANNGSIKVGGAGRTNATPNLNDGNIFVGNSSNKSVADSFTDVLNDQAGINSSANATAITIDSSENVQIGSNSFAAPRLQLYAAATGESQIFFGNDGTNGFKDGAIRYFHESHATTSDRRNMTFSTANTERMRIDASGNVGIGNSNPSAFNSLSATDKLVIGDSTDSNLTLFGTTYGSLAFADSDTSSSTAQYAGLIQYYHANNSMQFYTSSSEAMRIDSSGNIGIGVTNPDEKLDVEGNLRVENTSSNGTYVSIRNGATNGRAYRIGSNFVSGAGELAIYDDTVGAERLRIDDSGNLLVTTTQNEANTDANDGGGTPAFFGMAVNRSSNYAVNISSRRAAPLVLNRMANDGSIITLNQAGSTVGSIGVEGAELTLGSNGAGLQFLGSENKIRPFNMDTNAASNGVVSLGRSNAKFADLYLSGAIKMSSDLDDYEEGSWTPVINNGTYTYSYRRGHYVKIGKMVYVHIGFKINTASGVGSSNASITGLPFYSESYGGYQEPHARCAVAGLCVTSSLSSHLSFFVGNSANTIFARTSASNADSVVTSSQLWQNGTFIKLTLIYTTNA